MTRCAAFAQRRFQRSASAQDRPWQLLCLFARLGGQTPARRAAVPDKDSMTLRKQVSNLRQRLGSILPIAGEPIRAVHGTGAYRCIFKIGLDRRDGLPSPPERWDDCRFIELQDGRISISVKSKEVFAARSLPRPDLTSRKAEVLRMIASGMRNKEVAYELGVSEATINAHIKHAFAKLGVSERTHAVTTALRRGIIRL